MHCFLWFSRSGLSSAYMQRVRWFKAIIIIAFYLKWWWRQPTMASFRFVKKKKQKWITKKKKNQNLKGRRKELNLKKKCLQFGFIWFKFRCLGKEKIRKNKKKQTTVVTGASTKRPDNDMMSQMNEARNEWGPWQGGKLGRNTERCDIIVYQL